MSKSDSDEILNDLEVITLVLSGKIQNFEKIIRRYNGYLYKIGMSYGFEHNDVEDLMQDTYINSFLNLKKFESRSSFKTWIVRIMLNNCYHKKQKINHRESSVEEVFNENALFSILDENEQINSSLLNNELKEVLEAAIHGIPENYRVVFTLRELNGMSVRETSEALNITEENVKTRLNRSKAMLQKSIKKTYSKEELFEFNLIYCDNMTAKAMESVSSITNCF